MAPKQLGIVMTALGIAALICSVVSVNVGDQGKWFPVLLIGGGILVWVGIKKYRWA
jgi:hypothetical protein